MPYTVNLRIHKEDGSVKDKVDNCVMPDDLKEVYEIYFQRNAKSDHDYFEAVAHPTAEENRTN